MNPRAIGWLSIVLGVTVGITAIIGPLWLKLIDFRLGPNAVNQFVGGEIVSLTLVAPGLVFAGVLWLKSNPLAPALVMGLALYTSYTYTTAVLGQEYSQYDGNVENAFLLFTNLVLGGLILTVASWMQFGNLAAGTQAYPAQRMLAWIFIVFGGFFALAWTGQLRDVYSDDVPSTYVDGPALFWLIKFLDFAICIPGLILTGIGLRRGYRTARKSSFALAVFATCLITAVWAMSVAMQIENDPTASMVFTVLSGLGAIVLWIFTIRLLGEFQTSSRLNPAPASN